MNNPITIEFLEILDAIERRGSFAKAAEELHKAPSAISYAIQKIEEQLDISLFQRQGRRSILTPAGRMMLTEGREILQVTAKLASKTKEVATGWEPKIRIAVEFHQAYPSFFNAIKIFLEAHPTIELDICESVLNGGWEALEQDRVDLLIGAPGPIPLQKGFRAVALPNVEFVPVIAAKHPMAKLLRQAKDIDAVLSKARRIIIHDTSMTGVSRNEGFSLDKQRLYVQNIAQKSQAILAGLGVGHLPREQIAAQLDSGELILLSSMLITQQENFIVWKINNKGKGLKALTQLLSKTLGQQP